MTMGSDAWVVGAAKDWQKMGAWWEWDRNRLNSCGSVELPRARKRSANRHWPRLEACAASPGPGRGRGGDHVGSEPGR